MPIPLSLKTGNKSYLWKVVKARAVYGGPIFLAKPGRANLGFKFIKMQNVSLAKI